MKNKIGSYLYWFVAIFPFILSAAFYSRLPEQVAFHWDAADQPNGYASKLFAAFGVPALLLLVTMFVNFSISADPNKQNINRSPQLKFIIRWSIVILANIGQCLTIFKALDGKVKISVFVTIFVGLLIAAIGNYLPKCKYNYTIGIRLPWTLANEKNWRKTHRLAGFVWIIGGTLIVVNAFIAFQPLSIGIYLFLIIVPATYSYCIFQKAKIS